MDKIERLWRMSQICPSFPKSFWSLDEFRRAGLPDGLWFIRADDSWSAPRGPLTTREVVETSKSAGVGRFMIQEHVNPLVSGAVLVRSDGWLLESVTGRCDGLLRLGRRGRRSFVDKSLEVQWSTGRSTAVAQATLIHEIHDAIGRMRERPSGSLIEWIATAEGEVALVDTKTVGLGFIGQNLVTAPTWYNVGGALAEDDPAGRTILELPDTAVRHLSGSVEMSQTTFIVAVGSPLSHFCSRAFSAGAFVVVQESD